MNTEDKSSPAYRRRLLMQALAGVVLVGGTGLAGSALAQTVEATPSDVRKTLAPPTATLSLQRSINSRDRFQARSPGMRLMHLKSTSYR